MADALQLAKEVLKLRKCQLGDDHPYPLASMHNLALRYSEAGRRTEALQLVEDVVQLQTGKLGEDHPETLASERLLVDLSQGIDATLLRPRAAHRPGNSKSRCIYRFHQEEVCRIDLGQVMIRGSVSSNSWIIPTNSLDMFSPE